MYQNARSVLLLLAEATVISTEHKESGVVPRRSSLSSPSYPSRWQQLWDRLQTWFANRPSELLPVFADALVPLNIEFPSLLFTTAMGVHANAVYHIAALTMLQCKPRMTRLSLQKPPVAAPLWHSIRVCSIANSIDDPNTWDVLLIALLCYAARHMTHPIQQKFVGQTLDFAARSLAGWPLQREIRAVREYWDRALVPEPP